MAKHEFGIMPKAPRYGERYDRYEPEKYACISVDDDYVAAITERLTAIDFYWHTLSVKGKGCLLRHYTDTAVFASCIYQSY